MKEILISGIIGIDIEEKAIFDAIKAAAGETLKVVISSPGGLLFPGIAIYNMLKNYQGNVHTHLVGLGASVSSIIMLAGKRRTADTSTVFMIHNPKGGVFDADYKDAEKFLDYITRATDFLARLYASATKKPVSEIKQLMNKETYYFGREILDAGYVDEIVDAPKSENREDAVAYARIAVDEANKKIKGYREYERGDRLAAMMTEVSMGLPSQSTSAVPTPKTNPETNPELASFCRYVGIPVSDDAGIDVLSAKLNTFFSGIRKRAPLSRAEYLCVFRKALQREMRAQGLIL